MITRNLEGKDYECYVILLECEDHVTAKKQVIFKSRNRDEYMSMEYWIDGETKYPTRDAAISAIDGWGEIVSPEQFHERKIELNRSLGHEPVRWIDDDDVGDYLSPSMRAALE